MRAANQSPLSIALAPKSMTYGIVNHQCPAPLSNANFTYMASASPRPSYTPAFSDPLFDLAP
jgi:hypothetical protein